MKQVCRISGKSFEITDQDLEFYKKLGIPEPTLCPDERQRRRLAFRNDRVFYKRECDLSGKKIVSMYPSNSPYTIYHQDEWWSDKWNPMDFGVDYNLEKPFFEQFNDLMLKVPRIGMDLVNSENSDYCNYCGDDKNCYIDIAGESNEDCYYNLFTKFSKNTVDSTFVYNSENAYQSISCYRCSSINYCINLEDSSRCSFSIDLNGCNDCFLCSNLRNKQYFIKNKQYTSKEYFEKLEELKLDSNSYLKSIQNEWWKLISNSSHKYAQILNSVKSEGDNIINSKNIYYSFNVSDCEDSSYLYDVLDAKNCRDLNYSLYKPEMSVELISTLSMKFSAFSMASHYCRDVFYCDQCNNSSDLFGCIGLNNKQYCIFNKQYTKDKYFELKEKIIKSMKNNGEWGEFFPISLSPFGYNETVANDYFPLNKSEIGNFGGFWREDEDKTVYIGNKIDIPDSIFDVKDDILEKILECEKCNKNYRIVGPELEFYRNQKIPIPKKCSNCRHLDRMELRNPRKLFDIKCLECGIDIKSSFIEEGGENVYCEKCYNTKLS